MSDSESTVVEPEFYTLERKVGFTDLRFLLSGDTSKNTEFTSANQNARSCASSNTQPVVMTTFTTYKNRYHVRTPVSRTEVQPVAKRTRKRKQNAQNPPPLPKGSGETVQHLEASPEMLCSKIGDQAGDQADHCRKPCH
uniref:Uncharacterized protein n=1 Tax=Ciona savignyi TaxID=51511 RepID=H2Z2Y5_CIOSA